MVPIRGSRTVAALLLLGLLRVPAAGCEIRVRDSAFRTARDTHRLCLIADSTDEFAGEILSRLTREAERWGDQINLVVERIDADSPETDWRSLGLPSAPPHLPVTVLVGRDNGNADNFIIDHWEPEPDSEELSHIFQSPLRKSLADKLAKHLAVVIFCPQDPSTVSETQSTLQQIIDSGIAGERIGLSLLTVDRTDSFERLLVQFMGIQHGSPDTACIAFGRGKLMTPPLKGDEITASNINTLVEQIRQECSCSKPIQTIGVDLPLVWTSQIDTGVVLMDEELDLSTLDDQVKSLLTSGEPDDQTPLAIPPGRSTGEQQSISPATANASESRRYPAGMNYLFGLIAGVAVLLASRRVLRPQLTNQQSTK